MAEAAPGFEEQPAEPGGERRPPAGAFVKAFVIRVNGKRPCIAGIAAAVCSLALGAAGRPSTRMMTGPGIDLTDTFPEDEDARYPGCSPEAWRYFRERR